MVAAETLSIRTACLGDLLAVLGVYSQRNPVGRLAESPSHLERRTWSRMMGTEDLTVYLAEHDGEPVGTASLLTMLTLNYQCAPTAFVEAVVVTPKYRRQGVATAIMRRVLEDARTAGCNKIQLLSHKRHATDGAHRLYIALGFKPEAEGFRLYIQQAPAVR